MWPQWRRGHGVPFLTVSPLVGNFCARSTALRNLRRSGRCLEKDPNARGGKRRADGPDPVCISPDRDPCIVRHRNRRSGCLNEPDRGHQSDRLGTGLLAGPQPAPSVHWDADLQLALNPVSSLRRGQHRGGLPPRTREGWGNRVRSFDSGLPHSSQRTA